MRGEKVLGDPGWIERKEWSREWILNITANGVSPYLLLDGFGYTGGVDRLIQVNLVADGAEETGESVVPLLSLGFWRVRLLLLDIPCYFWDNIYAAPGIEGRIRSEGFHLNEEIIHEINHINSIFYIEIKWKVGDPKKLISDKLRNGNIGGSAFQNS